MGCRACFFFFQAEDGIRDGTVTGVQTCALPISGRRRGSVGYAVLENIKTGGYPGRLYAVNPHAEEILGVPTFPTVTDLPANCDLAVVCVPAGAVPEVAEHCGRRGVRAMVVISAGITGHPELRERLVAAVRRYGMRMVGPNCVGVA